MVQNISLLFHSRSNFSGFWRLEVNTWQGGSRWKCFTVTNEWRNISSFVWALWTSCVCKIGLHGYLRFWFIPALSISKSTLGHDPFRWSIEASLNPAANSIALFHVPPMRYGRYLQGHPQCPWKSSGNWDVVQYIVFLAIYTQLLITFLLCRGFSDLKKSYRTSFFITSHKFPGKNSRLSQ